MKLNNRVKIFEAIQTPIGGGVMQNTFEEVKEVFCLISQKGNSFRNNTGVMAESPTMEIRMRRPIMVDRGNSQEELALSTSHKLGFWDRNFRIYGIDRSDKRFYKVQAVEIL